MSTLLYITCNLKPLKHSKSLTVGMEFLSRYRRNNPDDLIEIIDVYRDDIQRFDEDVLNGIEKINMGVAFELLNHLEQIKLGRIWAAADKFLSADKYVFVTPMWSLGFPPELKVYLDNVCIEGKAFRFTDKGHIGLLRGKGKKCLSIHSSGGFHYGAPYDHSVPYLKDIMKFIGVDDFSSILLEGVDVFPEKADEYIASTIEKARAKAAVF